MRAKNDDVSPEEIKQLRKDLKLSARQLADAIKAEPEDIWEWEKGERFPTKRFVSRMLGLKKKAAAPMNPNPMNPNKARPPNLEPEPDTDPLQKLADPALWELVRKLVAHPKLFASAAKLAAEYPDPAVPAQRISDGKAPRTT